MWKRPTLFAPLAPSTDYPPVDGADREPGIRQIALRFENFGSKNEPKCGTSFAIALFANIEQRSGS
jgi:hypothetical protein